VCFNADDGATAVAFYIGLFIYEVYFCLPEAEWSLSKIGRVVVAIKSRRVTRVQNCSSISKEISMARKRAM